MCQECGYRWRLEPAIVTPFFNNDEEPKYLLLCPKCKDKNDARRQAEYNAEMQDYEARQCQYQNEAQLRKQFGM